MGYLINSGTGFLKDAVTTVSNVKSYLVNKTGYLVDAIRVGIGDFGQRVLDDGGTVEASAEAAASYREITKDIYDQASLVLFHQPQRTAEDVDAHCAIGDGGGEGASAAVSEGRRRERGAGAQRRRQSGGERRPTQGGVGGGAATLSLRAAHRRASDPAAARTAPLRAEASAACC